MLRSSHPSRYSAFVRPVVVQEFKPILNTICDFDPVPNCTASEHLVKAIGVGAKNRQGCRSPFYRGQVVCVLIELKSQALEVQDVDAVGAFLDLEAKRSKVRGEKMLLYAP